MTVTYSLDVASCRFHGFAKLLFRWKGSIYRLMYREFLAFSIAYYILTVTYQHVLTEQQKRSFDNAALYCRSFVDYIPLTFVLGFYITLIVTRWWDICMNLPWPDNVCLLISAYIQGDDHRSRLMRRTLARYLQITTLLCLQAISPAAKRRFPTIDSLVEAGIMTSAEKQLIDDVACTQGYWFQPFAWFINIVMQARKEGRIAEDILVHNLIQRVMKFKSNLGTLRYYDWISVPLVYTQVVTIAVYTFAVACLLGRQTLDNDNETSLSPYAPVFTFVQFFFYFGWLKVAEELINPLGGDDDDFEINYIIDRNLQVGFVLADRLHGKYPPMAEDIFIDENEPELPYTMATVGDRKEPFLGSTAQLQVPRKETIFIHPGNLSHFSSAKTINNIHDIDNESIASGFRHNKLSTVSQMIRNMYSKASGRFSRTKSRESVNVDSRHSSVSKWHRNRIDPMSTSSISSDITTPRKLSSQQWSISEVHFASDPPEEIPTATTDDTLDCNTTQPHSDVAATGTKRTLDTIKEWESTSAKSLSSNRDSDDDDGIVTLSTQKRSSSSK